MPLLNLLNQAVAVVDLFMINVTPHIFFISVSFSQLILFFKLI